MNDELEQKLKDLETARAKLKQQIADSAEVLDSIEAKISELKTRQEARMRADQRIDNTLLDNMRDMDEATEKRRQKK